MRGRDFLDTARRLAGGAAESDYRSAISRPYYALFLESRDALFRWGFVFPLRNSHREVQQRFAFSTNADLMLIADVLAYLIPRRNAADYDLVSPPHPQTSLTASDAVARAENAVALLDALEADSVLLAQAIADIRKIFP